MRNLFVVLLFCVASSAQTGESKIAKIATLEMVTIQEFSAMSGELVQLHDDKVTPIVRKHLVIVQGYLKQIESLGDTK